MFFDTDVRRQLFKKLDSVAPLAANCARAHSILLKNPLSTLEGGGGTYGSHRPRTQKVSLSDLILFTLSINYTNYEFTTKESRLCLEPA